ncbi:MAG: DNA polymerase IV [Candidatus Roseilinea sp.]|nr:MAG: DNA polymerase IV [Candidatus Roseilinea sp.]
MPTAQAIRLCPGLIVLPGSRARYTEYSKRVMDVLREYGGALQQISIDEAFLDATGLTRDPRALALEIQSRIRDEVGLPASIGVATSKLVAKMASGRAKPNGVLVVAPGKEADFLAPMPVGELWGIGATTAARLEQIGIVTIGDLQHASPQSLRPIFHDHAEAVIARAHGVDHAPVHAERVVKSISEERTFARDVRDPEALRRTLLALSDEVAVRLRMHNRFARTVHLKLRWHDFYTVTRQAALPAPTQLGEEIFAAVEPLWWRAWLGGRGSGHDRQRGAPIRLIGVGVSGLSEGWQMALFDDPRREARLALARTLDELRAQYGERIVRRASLLQHRR